MPTVEAELLRRLRRAGCQIQRTRRGHIRILTPGGAIVIMGGTPSDYRAWLNTRARLRQAGVPL